MPQTAKRPLTYKTVEATRPPESGRVEVFDSAMPGMCLRVSAAGAKTYILSTRVAGRQKRVTVGRASGPGAITLAEARRLAAEMKELAKAAEPLPKPAAKGRPVDARLKTFGGVAEEFISRKCPELARGREIEAIIRRELLPCWRDIPLKALRRRDARALTDAMLKTRPAAAYRLHETYKRVLNWALDEFDADEIGIDVSPFASLKPPCRKEPRGRALADPEIEVLWRAWSSIGYPFGDLQKLLLLTGSRRGEVAGMAWHEVSLQEGIWAIPASRTKSSREQIVPLSRMAVRLLQGLPRFSRGEQFTFTTTGGLRPVSGFSKGKAATDRRVVAVAGEPLPPWRWHDLRRTTRTGLARLQVPEIVAEHVLGHAQRGLVGTYNVHAYLDEKREALELWAGHLESIFGGAS